MLLFNTVTVDYFTHNIYTPCITSLCRAHSNCAVETGSFCSTVGV